MGFPDSVPVPLPGVDTLLEIAQYYQAIGNAVCPIVVASVANELIKYVLNDEGAMQDLKNAECLGF